MRWNGIQRNIELAPLRVQRELLSSVFGLRNLIYSLENVGGLNSVTFLKFIYIRFCCGSVPLSLAASLPRSLAMVCAVRECMSGMISEAIVFGILCVCVYA